jgi:hypothetical protein
MTTQASRAMRSARNALAEALGLGEPYPLVDLPVSVDPPIVPFGGRGAIAIADAERGVTYRLLGQQGEALPGRPREREGAGETLTMETPPVEEDATYRLRATRPTGRQALLRASAAIRVGLDRTLAVTLEPPAALPTTVDHGATLAVAIARSQEGVRYQLVRRPVPDPAAPDDAGAVADDIALSAADGIAGSGDSIRIASLPLTSDGEVRVRAVKTFGRQSGRSDQVVLLDARLPVRVRARADPGLTVDPPTLAHGAAAVVTVAGAEPGVRYRLHGAPIADAAFDRAEPPLAGSLPALAGLAVRPPAADPTDAVPPGFVALGDALPGAGADLALPTGPLAGDMLLLVVAEKTHASGDPSTRRLAAAVPVLVHPDPAPPLRLRATLEADSMTAIALVAGQPGTFYALAGAEPLGTLYHHQAASEDARRTKGIEAIAVGVDLVVAPDPATGGLAPPPLGRMDLKPLALPLELGIRARRAMTGLETALETLAIRPMTATATADGDAVRVAVADPVAEARYALLADGRPMGDAVAATGAPLELSVQAVPADARLAVLETPATDGPVLLERLLLLARP